MSTEPEEQEEAESSRSFDPEVLAMNKVIKLIRNLSPAAKAYVVERLKQP
jgi:hypothetical protein